MRKRARRRTPKQIAADKAAKLARQQERALKAAEKAAAWEADYPKRAARYKREHDERLEHERRRAQQRKIQEAGIEYIMGYDTPAARWVAEFVRSNEAANREEARRHAAASDPLNLTGHTPKPNKKQQRKAAEAKRLQRGERTIKLTDPENPNQDVLVSTMPHSFRRIKQMKTHHLPAAERFYKDWELANFSGLKSPGFDPRVDSSPSLHVGGGRAKDANTRLGQVMMHIGSRNYDICCAVLIENATASQVHQLGGRDHRSVSHDIEVALNALTEFYDPERLARDPTWRAFKRIIEAGRAVIAQGESEVG